MYAHPSPLSTSHTPYSSPNGHTMQHQSSSTDSIPSDIASAIKRQPNDPVLWFANPPINVPPTAGSTPVHSISYLNWKQQQQKQQP
ncbi:unnamed protein product [Absidia cylindrospora]